VLFGRFFDDGRAGGRAGLRPSGGRVIPDDHTLIATSKSWIHNYELEDERFLMLKLRTTALRWARSPQVNHYVY
jgi:hypothetical protein